MRERERNRQTETKENERERERERERDSRRLIIMVSLNAINDRASDPGFVIKLLPNEGTHRRMNEGFMCEG